MSRPLFMFRPNLRNAEHRKAWEVLQNVPEGQKSAFLVRAILETVQKEDLDVGDGREIIVTMSAITANMLDMAKGGSQ